MKRMLMYVMVVALLLFFSGAAYPAGLPSQACFQLSTFIDVQHLRFKSMGNVKTSAGNVKMYAVHGEHSAEGAYSIPVAGTAHLNGTAVHFSLSGAYNDGVNLYSFSAECFYDFADPANAGNLVFYRFFTSTGDTGAGSATLTSVDCQQSLIPYDATAGLLPANPKK